MTNPNDPQDADFRGTLPADLQDLDRELSGIRIEERPSFGPELEQELAQVWANREHPGSNRPRRWTRMVLAASLAGLMIAGVSVPSARAAMTGFVLTVAREVTRVLSPPEEAVQEPVLPDLQVPEPAPTPDPVIPEPRDEVVVSPVDASGEVETSEPDLPTIPRVEITFPELISRQAAADLIRSHYPLELQAAGIEGSVKLEFWVTDQGTVENPQLRRTSGNDRLDYAAMISARELKFRPSTRNGIPVGTWVAVDVHFFALTGAGIIGSDSMGSGM